MKASLTVALITLIAAAASGYDVSVGRLSYMEGDVWILKDQAVNWTDAIPNMVIEEGDIIETGRKSKAEVELCMGAVIWLNSYTRTEVLYLDLDEASIYISYGTARVKNVKDNQILVETKKASIYIDVESDARIEVKSDGRAELYVFEGWATIETDEEITTVWEGEKVYVTYSGRIRECYDCKPDGFDRFCNCRCERYTRLYVDVGIFMGSYDLDCYGTWVVVHPYGRVWRPRVIIGWRPYLCGYWFWDISFGWLWVSFEPWGFLPYHYGHWVWCSGYGWVWSPGRRWSPGWVVWIQDGPYIGWAPAGPGGSPPVDPNSWTFVSRESFYDKPVIKPINYEESIKNHPVYEMKDDIPKNKLKELNFTSAPEPTLTEISGRTNPSIDKRSIEKPHSDKRNIVEFKEDFGRVTDNRGEVLERSITPVKREVYIPKRSTQIEKKKPEQKRVIWNDKPSYKNNDAERKTVKPRKENYYKSSPTRKEVNQRVYSRSENSKQKPAYNQRPTNNQSNRKSTEDQRAKRI